MDQLIRFVSNQIETMDVRHETWDGRDYIVMPVVAIKPGVLNGSMGPELVTEAEIANGFGSWNNRPITLDHPKVDGRYVSANSPELLVQYSVGQLFYSELMSGGGLRGEMWIDVARASASGEGQELLRRAEAGETVEVSTAYFASSELEAGTWNGVAYKSIAHDLKPDHLAVLLHDVGACSWRDGCGAPRVNARYDGINFEPSEAMATEAARGLAWREEYGRGGTEIGVARARDIKHRRALSAETVRRMVSFFARHEVDKEADGFRPGEDGYPSNGRIAWALWGGDAGQAWASMRMRQMDAADEVEGMKTNILNEARTPSYNGTEEISWEGVAKTFEAYRDGYYEHSGTDRPEEVPGSVADAPAAMKRWIASKTLLGDPGAEEARGLIFFPVVNPSTDKLNAGAVRAVLGGRAAQADIPETALESARSVARRLLEDEFGGEPATQSAIGRAFRALGQALGLVSQQAEVDKEEQSRRIRESFYQHLGLRDEARWEHWVRAVFDERVIVEDNSGLLSYAYRVTDVGTIAFEDPVRVEIVYQPVESPTGNQADTEPPSTTEEVDVMDNELLAQVAAKFGVTAEEDADATLQALLAYELPTNPCAEYEALVAHVRANGGPGQALETLQAAEAAATERRQELVEAIRANEANTLTDEEMAAMDAGALEKLARMLRPVNYGGTPSANVEVGGQTYDLPSMGI